MFLKGKTGFSWWKKKKDQGWLATVRRMCVCGGVILRLIFVQLGPLRFVSVWPVGFGGGGQ